MNKLNEANAISSKLVVLCHWWLCEGWRGQISISLLTHLWPSLSFDLVAMFRLSCSCCLSKTWRGGGLRARTRSVICHPISWKDFIYKRSRKNSRGFPCVHITFKPLLQDRSKPGRQIVTFLLICNLSIWVIYTFEVQKVEESPVQVKQSVFKSCKLLA